MRSSFICECFDIFESVSTCGRPSAGPLSCRRRTLALTDSCSSAERSFHHSSNSSVNSTSHAIDGICHRWHVLSRVSRRGFNDKGERQLQDPGSKTEPGAPC